MKTFKKSRLMLAISVAIMSVCYANLVSAAELAQSKDAKESSDAKKGGDSKEEKKAAPSDFELDEIIVTGNPNWKGKTKLEASYGITTFDEKEITRISPQSTADLLGEVPGVFTEGATGGEASNNAYVRGIPSAGGFKFLPLLIDGLPTYEEPEIGFMNNDVMVRADLMTKRVETVRGGPSAIIYSNAIGGAANFITRTGGEAFEGAVKVEVGDWGHLRNDFFLSGPINKNLTFAFGGFYRTSNGYRDPGYSANNGGQLRGNIVWKSDDESTKVELHTLKINDKTIFYTNIPFTIPAVGDKPTKDHPATIDNVEDLGIDLGTGTTLSNGLRTGTLHLQNGDRKWDLADGIHANFDIHTLKFSKEFDDSWGIENNMRTTSGSSGFNGMFPGVPVAFDQFVKDRERNDVADKAFAAAGTCTLDSVYLSYYTVDKRTCGKNLGVNDVTGFIDKYKAYNKIGVRYADNSNLITAQTSPTLALNTLWLADIGADMFVDDFRVHKGFEFFGDHELTTGVYVSNYDLKTNFVKAEIVTEVKPNAKLLDIVALSNAGSQIGPSFSRNGVYRNASEMKEVNDKQEAKAFYISDDWKVNKDLILNVGWRTETLDIDSNFNNFNNGENLTPSNVVVGSTADTLSDNTTVGLTGRITSSLAHFQESGWTAGANYLLTDNFAVFGRLSDSFRMPRSEVIWADRAMADPVQRILQAETGIKYQGEEFTGYLTTFWNRFKAVGTFLEYKDIADPACQVPNSKPDLNNCRSIQGIYRQGTENLGAEVEIDWKPGFVPGFALGATVTLQDPKFAGGDSPAVEAIQEKDAQGNFVTTGYKIVNNNLNGNIPQRFPKVMASLRPSYDLPKILDVDTTLYASIQYTGERYSSDQNVNLYPGYLNVEAGALFQLNKDLNMQFHVTNLTDSKTLTEGDDVNQNNLTPDGKRNLMLGRPIFGRTMKLSLTYQF